MKQTDLTDEDAAAIGRAFMAKLPEGYSWGQCPTEYVTGLENQLWGANQKAQEWEHRARKFARRLVTSGQVDGPPYPVEFAVNSEK